ncbi:LytR cell envelope-related transcriptional attenuator [Mycolicibacterium rutilum]|uniref:LytR cell envelope-related transcriptional attenuator n=1 Tax=Mycolicibacterium rutilum TaxID=370526 RepID=A0A1H6IM85_MYCRU|nr:LytR C-terminal domain-containing protein [Mycolicibacterium rutilum]SEH50180.1 LytR cell envelope-related transcriptional attenuator [Mycolicibacterium rutilum]
MNQRDSSGLPLRAMVMVLLFLGVVFLLVGFQAMGSDDDDADAQSPIATSTVTSTPTSAPAEAEPERAEVRVFNISTVQGAAEGAANRLRDAGWNVTDTGNLELPDVTATTVYFSDAPGEREAAEEVGRLLEAPVEPRVPALAEQPPGVVVVVTG